jgi:hypothetical protein
MTPIGEASRGYLIMCMAPGGTVYGGYDDVLVKLGSSGDDTPTDVPWQPRSR